MSKIVKWKSGKHADGSRWFDLFLNLGKSISLFCSRKTQAYDIAFQSGIGGVIRWPFYSALFLSVISYPKGSVVEKHHDGGINPLTMRPILGFNFNIVLKKAAEGGKFICPESWVNTSRIKIFNGDKYDHEVTRVEKGKRVIFSFKFSLAKLV